jgi:hypothetical protein
MTINFASLEAEGFAWDASKLQLQALKPARQLGGDA